MSENMIERVASAIWLRVPATYGMTEAEAWDYAKAAIQEMRKPTDAMLKAGYGQHYPLDTTLGMNKAILDYDDMIRAALKEPTQ